MFVNFCAVCQTKPWLGNLRGPVTKPNAAERPYSAQAALCFLLRGTGMAKIRLERVESRSQCPARRSSAMKQTGGVLDGKTYSSARRGKCRWSGGGPYAN